MGDHMLFVMSGIPTVAMTASGIFELLGTVIHSPDDDFANIDFDKLDKAVRFLLSCIDS